MIIQSKYNPFTFDLLIKPYLIYGDTYKLLEDALTDLTSKANIWEGMVDKTTDELVYNLYKKYADDLKAQADILSSQGLSPAVRKNISELKRRYSAEITPIEQAYKERKEDIERQKKISDQTGGRTVFSRNARNTPLGDYMHGVEDYLQVNLDNVFKEAATGAQAISSRYFKTVEGKLFLNDYYNLITLLGINPEDAISILTLSGKYKDLDDYINKGLSKYSAFDNTSEGQSIYNSFMLGINAGIVYKEDNKPMTNWRLQKSVDDWYDLQKYRREHPDPKSAYIPVSLHGNPYSLASRLDINKSQSKHNEYAKYFDTKTGELTDEGWEVYNKELPSKEGKVITTPEGTTILTEPSTTSKSSSFNTFLNSLNNGKPVTRELASELYKANAKRLSEEGTLNADMLISTAFDVQFADSKKAKLVLTSGKNNGIVPTEEYTKEGYKNTGKKINLNDSEFKDATYAGEYGLLGNYVVITTTANKLYRVPLKVVNPSLDNSIKTRMYTVLNTYNRYADQEGFNTPRLVGNSILSPLDYAYGHLNDARGDFMAAFEQMDVEDTKVKGGQL